MIVTMAATLFLFTLLDRGHEPLWRDEPGDVSQVAVTPGGRTVLAVIGNASEVRGFVGYDGSTGDRLWTRDVRLSAPVLVAAGSDWFAVASPFPEPRLVGFQARGGNVLHDEGLAGEPRGVAADGDRLVVALRTGLVVAYDAFQVAREHRLSPHIAAVDAAGGRVALATAQGIVTVVDDHGLVMNATRPIEAHGLRLSADGARLAVAGRADDAVGIAGRVELFDLASRDPASPRWTADAPAPVSFVAISADGRRVIAAAETPPAYTVLAWDANRGGPPRWAVAADGAIARGDSGGTGGAALTPDGRFLAFATTLGEDVTVVDADTGAFRWSFETEGSTSIAVAETGDGPLVVANARLAANEPLDAVLRFDVDREPLWARFPLFPLLLAFVEGALGVGGLVGAYAWYRRQ